MHSVHRDLRMEKLRENIFELHITLKIVFCCSFRRYRIDRWRKYREEKVSVYLNALKYILKNGMEKLILINPHELCLTF